MTYIKWTALPLVAWLAAPAPLLAAEEGLFDINLGLSIWTVVVFLALLTVLWKFAWGPILGAVESREQRIQTALDDAAARQADALRMLEEHKAQLADARRQVQEIIAEGKAAGERVRRDIEEKARAEAEGILERARREIGREKDQAMDELRRESVEIAMAASARLLQQKLDGEQDRQLILGYVDELSGRRRKGAPA